MRQSSCTKASYPGWRMFIDGRPAWRCVTVGRPSRKLASACPVPSLVAVCGREAVGELVIPAVLEEPQHVPLEVAEVAADLQRVLAPCPGEAVADLQELVVVVAGRAEQRVAERLEALDVEERQPVRVRTAEPHPLDAELGDQVQPRPRPRRRDAAACWRTPRRTSCTSREPIG